MKDRREAQQKVLALYTTSPHGRLMICSTNVFVLSTFIHTIYIREGKKGKRKKIKSPVAALLTSEIVGGTQEVTNQGGHGLFLTGAEVVVPQELGSHCSFRSYSQKFTLGLLSLPLGRRVRTCLFLTIAPSSLTSTQILTNTAHPKRIKQTK